MYIKVLTVSALNNYIKKTIDADFILSNVNVKGEISNLKVHGSGHLYFSLKDEFGKINAVMFKNEAAYLKFRPENGMNVEVKGRVSLYTKEGSYQLYCNEMNEVGLGELYLSFINLKNKLEKEGLFSEEFKKPIPRFPRRIGIVTSSTGAALRDIINVSKRRNSKVDLLIYPSLVQGKDAPERLIKGIKYLNTIEEIDVIILARGGGSIEELWAFNNEDLAYAVFQSKKPIITGVGHETDFTIVDFISDRRAPTPSAAAEIAVPSIEEYSDRLKALKHRLKSRFDNDIHRRISNVENLKRMLDFNNPINYIVNSYALIDNYKNLLNRNIYGLLNLKKERLSKLNALLGAHSPLNILNKGYSVLQDSESNVISSVEVLKNLEEVFVTLKDGKIKGKVNFKGE